VRPNHSKPTKPIEKKHGSKKIQSTLKRGKTFAIYEEVTTEFAVRLGVDHHQTSRVNNSYFKYFFIKIKNILHIQNKDTQTLQKQKKISKFQKKVSSIFSLQIHEFSLLQNSIFRDFLS
jgi:hypothetical protein